MLGLSFAACAADDASSASADEQGEGSGSQGESSTTTASSSTTDPTQGSVSGSSSGGDATQGDTSAEAGTTDGGAVGSCHRSCLSEQDCCQGGMDCGLVCEAEVCQIAECMPGGCPDITLPEGGTVPGTCTSLLGRMTCVLACDDDPSVCLQPNSEAGCTGVAEDGTMFCREGCESAFVGCSESLTCNERTGVCECTSTSQCGDGFVCSE